MTPSASDPWHLVLLAVLGVLLVFALALLVRGQGVASRPPVGTDGDLAREWGRRLDGIDVRIAAMPQADRVGSMERQMDQLRGEVAALREAVSRIDRMVTMLVEHQLNEERGQ